MEASPSSRHTKVQKLCTLHTHGENQFDDEVVINEDKFPELHLVPGSLVQIFALKQAPAVRDFQPNATTNPKEDKDAKLVLSGPRSELRRTRSDSVKVTYDENGAVLPGGREIDPEKSYIFRVKPMSTEWKNKHPNLQISIADKVAKVFGFRSRLQVVITEADEEKVAASHVEITFRDEYLARADMWRMAISELSNRTVYRGQRIVFIGTIKATVKNIYINGKSTHSGYFSSTTKPIFRSESARYVLFIQMSKEMWDFDAEGAGEIMFNKVVHGFLPDLFKRWMKINARHLVTIILFTRMSYDGNATVYEPSGVKDSAESAKPSQRFRDYYRVVVSDMASGDWINILYQLKKEFRAFLRDVSLVPKHAKAKPSTPNIDSSKDSGDLVVAGKPCPAAEGNMLEAINLASAQFAKDYIDRDLVRTGISVVIITAGTGVFEVDYNMLKLTTDTLVGSGIGIDLVCLSPMPLHSVPLFKYRTPQTVADGATEESKTPKRSSTDGAAAEKDGERQRPFRHNFDSVLRQSPLVPKSSLSAINPPPPIATPQKDEEEWKYAMPHWLDISFWSGPSDEIVELVHSRPARPIGTNVKTKKKGSTFALRCRLYELQMMGVMENELHGISIPYMEEDSIYPYQLREYSESPPSKKQDNQETKKGSTSASTPRIGKDPAEGRDQLKSIYREWMRKYDDQAFSIVSDMVEPVPTPRLESPEKKRSVAYVPDERFLSSSYRSFASSLGKAARPKFDGHFHNLMRERSRESEHGLSGSPNIPKEPEGPTVRADVMYRQTHAPLSRVSSHSQFHHRDRSIPSTPDESPAVSRGNSPPRSSGLPPLPIPPAPKSKPAAASNRPGGWFLRQISFGGKNATSAKSTASIAPIDFTMGKPEPIKPSVSNDQKDAIAAKLASTRASDIETPSQPIAIRAASRAGKTNSNPATSEDNAGSVETVKGHPLPQTTVSSRVGSVTKDPGSTFLVAGSRALAETVGPKLELTSSGATKEAPRTLSPTNAIAPWAVLVNPCNPRKNSPNVASQFRRWQHVFPKRLKTSSVKWKSLCSPAAVPLTNEYFPTAEQLATEYNESPYKIAQNDDDELADTSKSRETLVRELIAFRLSHGFQIIVGPAVAEVTGLREEDISNILHCEYMTKDGDTVFMSLGNTIHQLVCVAGGDVEVKRFTRKPTTALQSSAGIDTPFPYRPFIRTAFEDHYQRRDVILRPPRKEYNWNFIDTFLAGYDNEFSDILRFWRARFVLIPVEIPAMHRRTLASLSEDSEEEIRLEGIRTLTQLWQKSRYIPPEERHFQATSKKQKDPNPLAILYHTRDPSAIVAAAQDSSILNDLDNEFQTAIFSETDKYHTSNIDLKRLAEDLQGENGIPMLDRRWHWRLHYNCFLGFDLTSWLLSNFRDIETRGEAVDLGNQLMEKGLFQHVQKRHQFRDGNFFFQIAPEYRTPRPDTRSGWFSSMKKPERSVPSTPLSEGPRSSPLAGRSIKSRSGTTDTASTSDAMTEGDRTPTRIDTGKRKVSLSRVMRYDVDARKRSYRPEIISLHYDRLHNPDNCYHIRIDWMNVTAKLIEDAIVTWATSVEKYGLKLVEVPIAEASNIIDHHPFRSPYHVKVALQPPQNVPERNWDPSHFSPQPKVDKFALHKALLRRLNYVLDMEAASAFPPDVDVTYSWGKPDYKYTQFIHRSGTVLAQITNEGDFLLLANRLAHNRAKDNGAKFRQVTDPYEHKRATASTTNPSTPALEKVNIKSPFASPLARPVQDQALLHTVFQERSTSAAIAPALNALGVAQTPEQVKEETEAFCADPIRLRQFYEIAQQQQNVTPGPSPHLGPVSDASIPSLGLPPAISIREASPAAGSGWAPIGGGLIATPRIETARDLVMARRQGSEGAGGSIASRRGGGEGAGTKRRRDSQGSGETFMS